MSLPAIRIRVSGKFGSLLQVFLQRCRAEAAKAHAAARGGDLAPALEAGHRMKGSGGFYGIDEISVLGGRIEDAARAGDAPRAARSLEELEAYLARLQPEFE